MMKKRWWVGVALLLGIAFTLVWMWSSSPAAPAESVVLPQAGAFTIAAVGDAIISRPVAPNDKDAAFNEIIGNVRGATVAIVNLETSLLGNTNANIALRTPGPRWPFGSAREAAELETLGFDVVSHANNHAADYRPDGVLDTRAMLAGAGLVAAGSGADLEQARAPVVVGRGARRIAALAVAISATPESMATPKQGSIFGRPGINVLRYSANVVVDARTYEMLRRSAPVLQGGTEAAGDQFTLLGTIIRKGTETSVSLVPDARDSEAILAEITRARAAAEVAVLSIHSHEPSNDSDEPADIFRSFARRAIDAGAKLIVGHGPHRLRGIEMYNGGVILYSVGNFLYQPPEGPPPPADPYDAGIDMYSLALGVGGAPSVGALRLDRDEWWEGVLAVATFDDGMLRSLRVHPVDLGVDLPQARRGVPRVPAPQRAAGMLEKLRRLSARYHTALRIENGIGIVDTR